MSPPPLLSLLLAFTLTTLPTGCAPADGPEEAEPPALAASALRLRGAGASMPYPVLNRWFRNYSRSAPMHLSYQQTDSAGGFEAVRASKVEFGASDVPLDDTRLGEEGLAQFPLVVGGLVPVAHLPGVGPGELVLDGPILAALFASTVTNWAAPEIRALNPGLELPHRDVIVVNRSDPSGSGWILAHYLARLSPAWSKLVLTGWSVAWPTGVGANGNAQVASFVGQFSYTLGFVEFSRAVRGDLSWVALIAEDGEPRTPSADAFEATVAAGTWTPPPTVTFQPPEVTPPGGWPIVGASYVLMRRERRNPTRTRALLNYFLWCYDDGAPVARKLGYAPLPAAQTPAIQQAWAQTLTYAGAPVWTAPVPDPVPAGTEPPDLGAAPDDPAAPNDPPPPAPE